MTSLTRIDFAARAALVMIVVGELTVFLSSQAVMAPIIAPLPQADWLSMMPRWLLALALVTALPIIEEVLFRGVIFGALAPKVGNLTSAVSTAVLWALVHAVWPPAIVVMYFVLGLALAWVRIRTQRVWPCIAAHAAYNAIPAAILLIFVR